MFDWKQKCELNDCDGAASTRCYCCNKSICTRHFIEHIDSIKAQVAPLANDVNTMVEKIRDLTIEQLTERTLVKLNQWRNDMHRSVEEVFVIKSKEIEEIVEQNKVQFIEHQKQQWETILKMKETVKQLVESGVATFQAIESLKKQLSSIEGTLTALQDDFLAVTTREFGPQYVTVSSTVNRSSTIQSPCPMPAITNGPICPPFHAATSQSSTFCGSGGGFPTTVSSSLFRTESTRITSSGLQFTAPASLLESDRFTFGTDSTGRRPIIKSKRRAKP